jgi:hypothetical protein
VRFGLISSAIAAVIGIACFAGSANASSVLDTVVDGSCSISSSDGCLFVGTINDNYYSNWVPGKFQNSYLAAVYVYDQWAQDNNVAGLDLSPIGETEYSANSADSPVVTLGYDPILDPDGNSIGAVSFCTEHSGDPNNICYLYDPSTNTNIASKQPYHEGDWSISVDEPADYIAVDGGGEFVLYSVVPPATSGTWSTMDIPLGNGNYPKLEGLVLFASVPEPATWAMFLLGFGMIGASMRALRRKGAVATA